MRVIQYDSSAEFAGAHAAAWLGSEAACGVLLRYRRDVDSSDVLRLAVVDEEGRARLTAIAAVDDQVVLSPGPGEAIARLAGWLAERTLVLPGIFGERSTALRFAASYGERTGTRFDVVKELLHEELRSLAPRSSSPGRLRPATHDDAKILIEFADASQAEGNTQRHFDSAARVSRELDAGQLFVWENDAATIVAGAGLYLDRSTRSGHVDGVYTRPDHRCRGFATSLVGALTQHVLDAGRVPSLSVDAENVAAVRVYERLGYEEVCRMANLRRM